MSTSRILVIDDDDAVLGLLEFSLKRAGYEVFSAIDGSLGLQTFQKQNPDLVIVDLAMPGMDGYQVIEELRKLAGTNKHLPIIILTAHDQDVMRDYGTELGADLYLTKPIAPKQLVEHVSHLLKD
ncbi:MAG: response regulator [Anaerolineae bacterium]|nr:response regulator [Anaerolineae bacterium]